MKNLIYILIAGCVLLFSCGEETNDEAKERVLRQLKEQKKEQERQERVNELDELAEDVDELIDEADEFIKDVDKKLSGKSTNSSDEERDPENDPVYYDIDLEVISFNSEYLELADGSKIKKPINEIKVLLVKMTEEPYLYCELKTEEAYSSLFTLTDEQWYDKDVGDILHFEYIRKDRFFKIEE